MPDTPPHPKRIGIFLTYDADGIVDDYVVHLLRDMRPNLDSLIILANGKLTDASFDKLRPFTSEIHVRPNEGFDSGAWQEGLLVHCGFPRLREHDELVLFNDSYFGPLYPFADVFANMASRPVDFWGLTVHGPVKSSGLCPYGDRPRYLQTYFLVFRQRILHSPAFQTFWEEQPVYRHFYELADRFGGTLTRHFADLGFSWAAYSDTTDLEDPAAPNFAHHSYNFEEMIVRRRYPVIKRRTFVTPRWNHLLHGDGSKVPEVLDFIRRHYTYDLNLAYDHLLRKHDPGDLKDCLNLNFIFRTADPAPPPLAPGRKIALAAVLLDPALFPRTLPLLRQLPPDIDLLLATDTADKQLAIERILGPDRASRTRFLLLAPGATGLPALLAAAGPSLLATDYLGFLHDRKPAKKDFPTVAANHLDLLWNNLLADPGYVRQLLAAFENNPRLGLLVPPTPYHGTFFHSEMHAWSSAFDRAARLARQLALRAPLRKNKPSVSSDTVFWCRTAALRPLLEAPAETWAPPPDSPRSDREALRTDQTLGRLLPFIAQSQGYFTGWALTDRQAAADLTNLRFMLDSLKRTLAGTPGLCTDTFAAFRLSLANLRKLLGFAPLRLLLALLFRFRHYTERRAPAFFTRFGNRPKK